jgi:uncharacterized protein YecE (DUF72 family)
MESRLSLLGDKAGPVLFQLPPNFKADADRLSSFLRMLAPEKDVTVSNSVTPVGMRHGSCASWRTKTSRFAFLTTMMRRRLGNGRRTLSKLEVMAPGGHYKGHYSASVSADWAKRIKSWKSQGCDVFDNDQKSAAPSDALKLKQLLRPAGNRPASGATRQRGVGQGAFSYRNLR